MPDNPADKMIKALRRDDPEPLYKQIKRYILDGLRSGDIPAQGKIASEREFVDMLGVSRITVRQAMKELVLEGYLQSQPGKGFYATGRRHAGFELELLRSFTETALAHGRTPGGVLLAGEVVPAPEEVARRLGVEEGSPAVSLRRLRLLDGVPVMISHDWLVHEAVPDLLDLDWAKGNRSLYAELQERYGVRPQHGQTVLSAALATPEEQKLLRLSDPAAVLTVEQIAFDAFDAPINLTHSVQHPAAYPLRLDQGRRRHGASS